MKSTTLEKNMNQKFLTSSQKSPPKPKTKKKRKWKCAPYPRKIKNEANCQG